MRRGKKRNYGGQGNLEAVSTSGFKYLTPGDLFFTVLFRNIFSVRSIVSGEA